MNAPATQTIFSICCAQSSLYMHAPYNWSAGTIHLKLKHGRCSCKKLHAYNLEKNVIIWANLTY